jgi:hypothetical protein
MKSTASVLMAEPLKKIAALGLVKYSVPPPQVLNAKEPEVVTVAVPAVIVQTPVEIFWMNKVSPALNNDVLTVIVVALAEFIAIRVPLSAATSV